MNKWTKRAIVTLIIMSLGFVVFLLISLVLPSWLWHPLGGCTGTKVQVRDCLGYNSWSGIFSDIAEYCIVTSLLTALYHTWRHLNCAEPTCPKIGKYKTADGLHRYCGPHHPDKPHLQTREEIHARHHAMTKAAAEAASTAADAPAEAAPAS